jgi:hypothetical protein
MGQAAQITAHFLGIPSTPLRPRAWAAANPAWVRSRNRSRSSLENTIFSETRESPNSGPAGDHRTQFLRKVHNRLAGFVEETKPLLCLPAGGRTRRLAGDPLAAR